MLRSLRLPSRAIIVLAAATAFVAVALAGARPATAATLDDVRTRGHLVCGINDGYPGFAMANSAGQWAGLEIDFCQALAAAIFGRRDAVKFRPLSPSNRIQALIAGEVDLVARAMAWSLSRDLELGVRYAGTLFHDGQAFLVRRGYAVASVLELSGASVCVMQGTSAEEGLSDYFRTRQMRFQIVVAERWQDVVKAYADGACTLLTGDLSVLAVERTKLDVPADHMILPELISNEPSGPVVRPGDDKWFSIVSWTLNALMVAEEMQLTKETVDTKRETSKSKNVRRFLGLEGNLGEGMGLTSAWSYNVLKAGGNYGEVFERTLGKGSAFGLDRGVNDLWTRGGLMYSLPLR